MPARLGKGKPLGACDRPTGALSAAKSPKAVKFGSLLLVSEWIE